ncbi:MAG TPA: pectinesterase family protein, partial [Verrucomicrobiae bacterium]|nr:pectinesterase family protein [Verrucomicrobiae bacterium]
MKRIFSSKIITLGTLLILRLNSPAQTNLFVAQDGSAQFKTVQAAIMSVPSASRENPTIIHIAPGTYKELIYVQREKAFFRLIGENLTNTILSF